MVVTIEEMAAHLQRLRAERQARADVRAARIRRHLPLAAQLLRDRHGAQRVVLFGSFARGDATERSDVDIAVQGLNPLGYFAAMADLTGLLDSPVDIVEIEQAQPSMLARLELEGIDL